MKKLTSFLLSVVILVSVFSFGSTAYAYDYKENSNCTSLTPEDIGFNQHITINAKAVHDRYGFYIERNSYFYYTFYAKETGYYDFTISGAANYEECIDSLFLTTKCQASKGYDIEISESGNDLVRNTVYCTADKPVSIEIIDYSYLNTDKDYDHYYDFVVTKHVHDYDVVSYDYDEYTNYHKECKTCHYSCTVKKAKVPKKVTLSKVSPAKKAANVSWKKLSCSGYQIQLATDKKFKKNKKSVYVKEGDIAKCNVKSLKANKTYYVRVRAYNSVDDKKTYGKWSTVKTVKVK